MILVTPNFLRFIELIFTLGIFKIGGLAIFPFIFVPTKESKEDKSLINHEKIHLRQQAELLFFGFVILYFVALFRKGYRNISFEKEAYQNMYNLDYLKTRPWFSWRKYL